MYNKNKFNCTRGNLNCEALGVPGTTHFYVNLEDTIFGSGPNNMTNLNYFPPNFAFREGQVQVNDLLFLRGSDGSAWALISDVTPTVRTTLYPNAPSILTQTINTTASGPWATPIAVTFELTSIEKRVFLTCTTPSQAAASIGDEIGFPAGVLNHEGYAPKYNDIEYLIPGIDNSVDRPVTLSLQTNGDISIYNGHGNFTASGIAGFYRFFVSYEAA